MTTESKKHAWTNSWFLRLVDDVNWMSANINCLYKNMYKYVISGVNIEKKKKLSELKNN